MHAHVSGHQAQDLQIFNLPWCICSQATSWHMAVCRRKAGEGLTGQGPGAFRVLPDSCGSPRSHKHPKEQSQGPVQSPRRLASPRTPLQPGHGCAVPPRHCSPQTRLPCCSPLPAISPSPACRVRGTPELGCLGGCITQPGIGCAAPMALLIAEHPAPKSTALGWWGRGLGGQGGSACCLWAAKGTGASCIALVPRQPPLLALRLLQVGAPLFPRIASAQAMPCALALLGQEQLLPACLPARHSTTR